MALERCFVVLVSPVARSQTRSVVAGAGDRVAAIGCDCHGTGRVRMALERRFGFPPRKVPNAQRVVAGAGDRVATRPEADRRRLAFGEGQRVLVRITRITLSGTPALCLCMQRVFGIACM
jgi:hypothetical protein